MIIEREQHRIEAKNQFKKSNTKNNAKRLKATTFANLKEQHLSNIWKNFNITKLNSHFGCTHIICGPLYIIKMHEHDETKLD